MRQRQLDRVIRESPSNLKHRRQVVEDAIRSKQTECTVLERRIQRVQANIRYYELLLAKRPGHSLSKLRLKTYNKEHEQLRETVASLSKLIQEHQADLNTLNDLETIRAARLDAALNGAVREFNANNKRIGNIEKELRALGDAV